MHTIEDLELMSDHELNIIASSFSGVINPIVNKGKVFGSIKRDGVINISSCIDYCGKWGDCGSLIDQEGIMISNCSGTNKESSSGRWDNGIYKEISVSSLNIKRSVTIVYILIKQCRE